MEIGLMNHIIHRNSQYQSMTNFYPRFTISTNKRFKSFKDSYFNNQLCSNFFPKITSQRDSYFPNLNDSKHKEYKNNFEYYLINQNMSFLKYIEKNPFKRIIAESFFNKNKKRNLSLSPKLINNLNKKNLSKKSDSKI